MVRNELKEKVTEIFRLGLELGEPKYKPITSVRFSGIVDSLSVLLYENGWRVGVDPTNAYSIYLDDIYEPEHSYERLDEIIAEMNRLIEVRLKMEDKDEF